MTRNFFRFSALALLLLPAGALAQVGADPHAATLGASAWASEPRDATSFEQEAPAAIGLLGDLDDRHSIAQVWLQPFPGMDGVDLASLADPSDIHTNHGPVTTGRTRSSVDIVYVSGMLHGGAPNLEREDGRWGEALDLAGTRRGGRRPTGGTQTGDPTNPVPEPATVMLLASGLLTVGLVVRARALA